MKCCICGKKAKWVRKTQFSGTFCFCKKHAKMEEDFKKSNSSYFYWVKAKHVQV